MWRRAGAVRPRWPPRALREGPRVPRIRAWARTAQIPSARRCEAVDTTLARPRDAAHDEDSMSYAWGRGSTVRTRVRGPRPGGRCGPPARRGRSARGARTPGRAARRAAPGHARPASGRTRGCGPRRGRGGCGCTPGPRGGGCLGSQHACAASKASVPRGAPAGISAQESYHGGPPATPASLATGAEHADPRRDRCDSNRSSGHRRVDRCGAGPWYVPRHDALGEANDSVVPTRWSRSSQRSSEKHPPHDKRSRGH